MDKGIIYYCIHKRAFDKCNVAGIMAKKDFCRMLGELYRVPKKLRVIIIKEMEQQNMIKVLGATRNNNIKVNPIKMNPEDNLSKLYKKVGLF